ncbi:MAG: T9SS type A sorting domain-containing protein [Flavobacterium sp.]|nr:MAG: T9SS type A sorting domain-containing protein [Flavobacterium sp.]
MMKHYLLLVIPLLGFGQTQSVLNVATADLVYSQVSNKIYATIPGASVANANTIAVIAPATAALENTYPIGIDPEVLAISADGQIIYVSLKGSSSVRKFTVATNTPGAEFSLGSDTTTGMCYAEDIQVMPSNSNTVAIAMRNHNYAPKHEGVAIFDNGVMRQLVTNSQNGANRIAFSASNKLFGLNNESSERKIRIVDIVTTGADEYGGFSPAQFGKPQSFFLAGGNAFFSNGKVMNVASNTIIATINDVDGPATQIDANTVCYASTSSAGATTLRFYSIDGTPLGSFDVTQATGRALNVISCGSGCVALNTPTQVIVVNNLLSSPSFENDRVSIYPNPVGGQLNISAPEEVQAVAIYDLAGKKVLMQANIDRRNPAIDASALAPGSYLVTISTAGGSISKKIIKL